MFKNMQDKIQKQSDLLTRIDKIGEARRGIRVRT